MSHPTSKHPVIRVRFFAHLRTLVGTEEMSVPALDSFSVGMLVTQLQHAYPALQAAMQTGKVVIAVNQEVVRETDLLHDGDEVALLPPFSGGAASSEPLLDHVRIQTEDFDVAHEIRKVQRASKRIGAVVTFLGTARDFSQGRSVHRIVFEHYPNMAEKRLAEIRSQALSEHDILEVTLIHRVGEIPIGDHIVLIVVGAQHRKEAFDACAWCIDTLKKITPIWKKETTLEGDIWVEHP
jgi:molybdopterin synthase catalytic subunit